MPIGIYTRTEEHKRNMSLSLLGREISSVTKKKMSLAHKGLQKSEDNGFWKGDKVGYWGIHKWIVYWYGQASKCENLKCVYPRLDSHKKLMLKPKRFEWANISKKYLRDISDWMSLCPSCHRKFDHV